jgi:hypothetical protein
VPATFSVVDDFQQWLVRKFGRGQTTPHEPPTPVSAAASVPHTT